MITRSPRKVNYTVVNNAILNDKRLSFKAKGMLVYLLSKPDHWQVSERHLATVSLDGIDSVQSSLKELEKAGYLQRERVRNADGTFASNSVVHEEPQVINHSGLSTVVNPLIVSTELVSTELDIIFPEAQPKLLQEEKKVSVPVQPPSPLQKKKEPTPVARPPSQHQELMVACSEALLGHAKHSLWTAQQAAMLGQAAKKLHGDGVVATDVTAWLHEVWPTTHWGKQGDRPMHDTFMAGVAAYTERREKATVQPEFILVPNEDEIARRRERVAREKREWEQQQSKEDNHA